MAAQRAMPWHEGEEKIQIATKVPRNVNPTWQGLAPRGAQQIAVYPLMVLGTTDPDDDNRIWTTVWGGKPPMAQVIANGGIIGIKSTVDATFDPVLNVLLGKSGDGEIIKQTPTGGAMVSALSLRLENRDRWKLYGRMLAGALDTDTTTGDASTKSATQGKAGNVQLVVKVEQSLGNCPKYINKKEITVHPDLKPELVSTDIKLCQEALDLIENTDMFFISSTHNLEDMDTNHRGGPPGFIRAQQPEDSSGEGTTLVWPEYSGNNLYQTLGNLMTTPRAGVTIPDYETGSILYLSGDTTVLVNKEASDVIAKSKLAVRFTVTRARFVRDGLGFRGRNVDDATLGRSPYNPKVRYLQSEKSAAFTKDSKSSSTSSAQLVQKQILSPSVTRYRFSLSNPSTFGPWKPGQYVALDFSSELDMGYSHMRDDDPLSINDDFIRTFTVASPPGCLGIHGEEFDVVVRTVGNVTKWLTTQRPGLVEVDVMGFEGEFTFGEHGERRRGFIAAGAGITPLLGQRDTVIDDLLLQWSVSILDAGLANYVLDLCSEQLKSNTVIYLTGKEEDLDEEGRKQLAQLLERSGKEGGIKVQRRRITKEDLTKLIDLVDDWYLCTTPKMREVIQSWLPGKNVVFENFDY